MAPRAADLGVRKPLTWLQTVWEAAGIKALGVRDLKAEIGRFCWDLTINTLFEVSRSQGMTLDKFAKILPVIRGLIGYEQAIHKNALSLFYLCRYLENDGFGF